MIQIKSFLLLYISVIRSLIISYSSHAGLFYKIKYDSNPPEKVREDLSKSQENTQLDQFAIQKLPFITLNFRKTNFFNTELKITNIGTFLTSNTTIDSPVPVNRRTPISHRKRRTIKNNKIHKISFRTTFMTHLKSTINTSIFHVYFTKN